MGADVNHKAYALQFGQLRARLEATFSDPALIVVTSAEREDGKTASAFGLAQALAEADLRVLFIDANAAAPVLPRFHIPALGVQPDYSKISRYAKPVAGQRFLGISFADERLDVGMSMDKVKSVAFDLRSHFDFVVVDTSPLLQSDLAVLFAAIADGTFLAVRLGRLPSPADKETMKTLSRVGANVLGALTVSQSMIKDFAGRRQEVYQKTLFPARHLTSRHTIEPGPAKETVESSSGRVTP
jgi:Mrp family chromosome partitioning ATPase